MKPADQVKKFLRSEEKEIPAVHHFPLKTGHSIDPDRHSDGPPENIFLFFLKFRPSCPIIDSKVLDVTKANYPKG